MMSDGIFALAGGAMLIWTLYLLAKHARKPLADAENRERLQSRDKPSQPDEPPDPRPVAACERQKNNDNGDGDNGHDALVELMLAQGRYTLLLRPQIAREIKREQFERAMQALGKGMALVPDGEVMLGKADATPQDASVYDGVQDELSVPSVRVQRFFLDRYPVTNRQYYEFTAAGGYEQIQLWDEAVLPAMLDFVDKTGRPGPRYWREGCYLNGQENRPVVGVSWYEAAAYAGWAGKRMPTDAEWVKAGCWPVNISNTSHCQRRYPWGETMDRDRANLWSSGPERIVDVEEFAEGVSVGGVYQLIGNVWEWTSDAFRPEYILPEDIIVEVPLKSIHGGAFDTYFDSQATCQFQSGEAGLARRHNIGFRLAIGVCDLVLSVPEEPVPEEPVLEEEVAS
jgi:iron(II)-dependent oxidoreductase